MVEKRLNLGKKVIYGFGDLGGNFLAVFIGAFIMIYTTNSIGLNPGIIGTLMLIARIFDGINDIFVGTLIDHTHTKSGKARPWMLWSTFLCAISIVAIFSFPTGISKTAQYVYFFVIYVLANAFFYTVNNIAYSTLAALITKDPEERVQLGTSRYVCATIAIMTILSATVPLVNFFGGGTSAWRTVAIIYAIVFFVFNMICVLFLKEIPEEELGNDKEENSSNVSFAETIKTLMTNKYFLLILVVYLVMYLWTGIVSAIGTYYMTYVMGNASLLGMFSTVQNLTMMLALIITPILVRKFSIHKSVMFSLVCAILAAVVFAVAIFSGKLMPILAAIALLGLCGGPLMGVLSATVADIGTYIFTEKGIHVEGALFSCSSIGIKVGSGIGGAVVGWALAFSGYNGALKVQPASAIFTMKSIFAIVPVIVYIILLICFSKLDMEKAIAKLKKEKGVEE